MLQKAWSLVNRKDAASKAKAAELARKAIEIAEKIIALAEPPAEGAENVSPEGNTDSLETGAADGNPA